MRTARTLIVLLILIAAAGCATSADRRFLTRQLDPKGVDAALAAKIEKGKRLDLSDIEQLVRRGIPDESIIAHIRETRATYTLTTSDIDRLRTEEVSQNLIDFLLSTPTLYGDERPYGRPYRYSLGFHLGHHHGRPYGFGLRYHGLAVRGAPQRRH